MANCPTCGSGLRPGADRCDRCGNAIQQAPPPVAPQAPQQPVYMMAPPPVVMVQQQPVYVQAPGNLSSKSKTSFVIIAIFFGALGIHNFYAGYTGKGALQLIISIVSFGFLAWAMWIWAIIEAFTVTRDSNGLTFS